MSDLKEDFKGGDQVQLADGIIKLTDLPHGRLGKIVGYDQSFKDDNSDFIEDTENETFGIFIVRGYVDGVDAAILPNKSVWFEVSKYDVFIKPLY